MQPGGVEEVRQDAPGLRLEADVEGQVENAPQEPQPNGRESHVSHQSPVDFAIAPVAVQPVGHRQHEQVDGEVPGVEEGQCSQAEGVQEWMLDVRGWKLEIRN